jgi:AraC-like DNA-binding protein
MEITRSFDDPEAFRGAIAAASADLVLSGLGPFRGKLTRVVFPKAHVQRGHSSRPVVLHAGVMPRAVLSVALPGEGEVVNDGTTLRPGELLLNPVGGAVDIRTQAGGAWNTTSFTVPDLMAASMALNGDGFEMPRAGIRVIRPAAPVMDRLLRFRQATMAFAQASGVTPDPVARTAFEDRLLEAAAACLAAPQTVPERLGERRARDLVARFRALLPELSPSPGLVQICTALGVPLRTLNTGCRLVLGVGAARYIRSWRLHAVRRALLAGGATVTQAATEQGFWELGRFAASYRAAFGERPSDTLARAGTSHRRA